VEERHPNQSVDDGAEDDGDEGSAYKEGRRLYEISVHGGARLTYSTNVNLSMKAYSARVVTYAGSVNTKSTKTHKMSSA
jgi:hypothetical protein